MDTEIMGIQSASATFTRFFVPEPVTEDFWSFVQEKLKAGSFNEPDDVVDQTFGFANWEDFFESNFDGADYHKGELVAFQFRMDHRKVAPIVLKKFVHDAVRKHRLENEGNWPSRVERREIQENMQNMLLSRSLPHPSACEVVWNPSAHWMILGTSSPRMMDPFLEHFEKHFEVYPIPLYHSNWALHGLALTDQQKNALEGLLPSQSSTAMEDGRFLGLEFLTWLWFFVETGEGRVELSGGKTAEVHLGERFVLTLPGEGREKVVCTTQANWLHEARTALRQGKLAQELQVLLIIGENEYLLTLDSGLWAFKGLKTPRQMRDAHEDDEDSYFLEKMFFIEEVSSALDMLYSKFLSDRLGGTWELEILPQLKAWIHQSADEEAGTPEPAGEAMPASKDASNVDEPPF